MPKSAVQKSFLNQHWKMREVDERLALAFTQRFGLKDSVARILSMRGINLDNAEDFLNPTLRNSLPNPFHFKDMEKAATKIADSILAKKNIAVFGDYDVDGATSSALLKRFFRSLGAELRIYIPDRIEEGYGPNSNAMNTLKQEGISVVITVDCGTVSYEPIITANALGLEVIVIDHHVGAELLPEAFAVVNPNRMDETSPHKHLAAAGMSFMLAVAVTRTLRERNFFEKKQEPDLLSLLDLVALGTVCDVMPLTGINRTFVAQGLKMMGARKNIGLTKLADIAGMDGAPSVYHAGFLLGPRINAGGRVGLASLGATLLSTEDAIEAERIAKELDGLNRERQALEAIALEHAIIAATKIKDDAFILVGDESWHAGVIGIIAGRIKEQFGKPTAVISWTGDIGKASARSIQGVDLGAAIAEAKLNGLLLAGGGHAMAAGFTIEKSALATFQTFINEKIADSVARALLERTYLLDGSISASGVTSDLATSLERLGPYGVGHPEPRFVIQNVRLAKTEAVGRDHLRLYFTEAGPMPAQSKWLRSMLFRFNEHLLYPLLELHKNDTLHVAGKIRLNRWQGKEYPDFQIEDAMIAD